MATSNSVHSAEEYRSSYEGVIIDDAVAAQRGSVASLSPRWLMATGALAVFIGMFALIVPQVAALAAETLVGIALIAYGLMSLFNVHRVRKQWRIALSVTGSILGILTGIALLIFPWVGMVTLTIFAMAFLAVSGIEKISFAFSMAKGSYRAWMGLTGILDVFLAILVFSFLPNAAAWVLGVLVGVSMIFHGAWLLAVGLDNRKSSKNAI